MKIERFRVQNYKSIKDVTVEGLSEINVFFGQNDVGKSNTLEALALTLWLLHNSEPISPKGRIGGRKHVANVADMCRELAITLPFVSLYNGLPVFFDVTIRRERNDEWLSGGSSGTLLMCGISLEQRADKLDYTVEYSWEDDKRRSVLAADEKPLGFIPLLHVIHAERRLATERRGPSNGAKSVSHHNLKQALFYAYLSSDLQQKQRLEAIREALAEPPFELGLLDVALNPETDEIDIGFVRPEGRLPIESLGSGSQQLLLILGQVFLNNFPIIALEEPEMNLSPQHQQDLLVVLRRLMQDPRAALTQLFISTHSPYFEFTENFYDVSLDEKGHTQVIPADKQRYDRYFAVTPVGPDTKARLNSLNQVRLYDGLIVDLGLKRGDLVIFVKNETTGRWEVRPAREVAQELQSPDPVVDSCDGPGVPR